MLTLIATLLLLNPSFADGGAGSKSRLDMYIQGDDSSAAPVKGESFTAKVRVVRDLSGDTEVFFEGAKAKGAYTLPQTTKGYAGFLQSLEASRKPSGAAVSVTADNEKRITSVELQKSAASDQPKGNGAVIPTSPDGKWNFGDLPP